MKKALIGLMLACFVFTVNAKSWKIIGKALPTDTTLLLQDATDTDVYKYVGKISNNRFKLSDGSNTYVPHCGMYDPMEQDIEMEIQKDEHQLGFQVSYVNYNDIYEITLTNGDIPKIMVEKVILYDHIYLVGGPVNTHDSNWLLSDARELEKDPDEPFIFYYKGFLKYNTFGDERGSIKFLISNSAWEPAFHPFGSSNIALAQANKMRLGGSDTKWEIPSDGTGNGYYVIKLNTLNKTISIEHFKNANIN